MVEIKNNNLTLFNIDALFQKEHRLKTMSKWDDQKWQEIIGAGAKIEWAAVIGLPYQGKTQLANILSKHLGFKLIDWKALEEEVKKSLGTEDAPFEGVPPTPKIEDAVVKFINADKAKGLKVSYVFDSFPYHQSAAEIAAFTSGKLKSVNPNHLFDLCNGGVDQAMSALRYKKGKEIEGDLSEEQQADFKKIYNLAEVTYGVYVESLHEAIEGGLVRYVTSLRTDATSEQTQVNILKGMLKPRVILVNHEKRLSVDTTCSNLGIKYNMLYISVYQLIKQHIEENTSFGKALLATKKPRALLVQTQSKDEFGEHEYSAAHFDTDAVIGLLQHAIALHRKPSQRFILIEGLCNAPRLAGPEDRMELRLMDELFAVQRHIGEVQAVIGLQFNSEKEYIDEDDVEWEQFEVEQPPAKKEEVKPVAEGEEPPAEQPPAEEAAKPKNAFKPEDWKWTATNRKPKNLAQLFVQSKGPAAKHEIRAAEQYSSSQYEAISKSLDEFCSQLLSMSHSEAAEGGDTKYLYQQVIFSE